MRGMKLFISERATILCLKRDSKGLTLALLNYRIFELIKAELITLSRLRQIKEVHYFSVGIIFRRTRIIN